MVDTTRPITTKEEAIEWCRLHDGGSVVAPENQKHPVSFRVPAYLKVWIDGVAKSHNRKVGEQFITSVEDGLFLQKMIKEVSAYLDKKHEEEPEKLFPKEATKPTVEQCRTFIEDAVLAAMKEG